LGATSWTLSAPRQRCAISHERLERTSLRVGAFTDSAVPALRCKELGLGFAASELPVRQDQGRIGDPSSSRCCARVFRRAGSTEHGEPGLLERAFGVLGVVARLELGESVGELCGPRLGMDRIG